MSTPLTQEVDDMINAVKHTAKARKQYSFLFNRYPDHIQKEMEKRIEEGMKKGRIEMARNMKAKGYPISDIRDISGLTKQEIEELTI